MSISPKTRRALHERAQDCCEICGKFGANNAHHRRNQSQGGSDTLANLLLLCGSGTTGCHGFVTTEPKLAKRMGWTVQRIPGPEATPVWRFSVFTGQRERVLLDDEGGFAPVAQGVTA